jgi:hypothetical protein
MELQLLKEKIEAMDTKHHSEFAKILQASNTPFNENKNGIFVNLSNVSADVIAKLNNYAEYIVLQEDDLKKDETEKNGLINTYFSGN